MKHRLDNLLTFLQGRKDDEFLCSLSAFDAYIVTRLQKTPKPYCFAVKSTDPITLFENKADYVHVFSCYDDVGSAWFESILQARVSVCYNAHCGRRLILRYSPTSYSKRNMFYSATEMPSWALLQAAVVLP